MREQTLELNFHDCRRSGTGIGEFTRSQQFVRYGRTVDWREAKTSEIAGGSFSSDDQGFDTAQTYVGHQRGNQECGQTCTSCAFRNGDHSYQANLAAECFDTGAAEEAGLVPADMKLHRFTTYSANGQ